MEKEVFEMSNISKMILD